MKSKNPLSSKTFSAALAIFCIGATFTGWGYLSGLGNKKTSIASVGIKAAGSKDGVKNAVKDHEEVALTEPKSGPKKEEQEANVLFNDPFIQNKWGLEKTSAHRAWEITRGSKEIVIAVIDTGIDANHKNLIDNLWVNPGESGIVDSDKCRKTTNALTVKECNKATNGIDDDANGFIDDVHGWNFVYNDNHLVDNHGHGTHIAGIIAAKSAAGGGVSGVAPNVSIMALKYYDPKASNSNNLKNTIQAIQYAVKMKANIINYSGGGTDYSPEEFQAIKEAEKAGILFVAAAGNERSNSDESGKHYYPADYDLTNIISVTAVNKEDTKVLPTSNYGVRTVDLAAPGENIYSTLPGNTYGAMTGTSQATAFVTGVAALVMSINRDFSASDVKKYILRTGDEYATLLSKTGTAKLLNSYRALTSLDKGVSVNGVVDANTAKFKRDAFAANEKDAKFVNTPGEASGESTESIAMFNREFMKAMHSDKLKAGPDTGGSAKPR
jgi:thermitase